MPAQGAGASKQQALFGIPAQKSSPAHTQTPQVPARPVPSPAAPQQNHAAPLLSPEDILAGLDEDQRRVASELNGAMRVLAGAGTGKTRAITHRIAYGIACGKYVPQRVMALTFTTRAAAEMRLRLRCRRSTNPYLSLRSAASTQVFLAQRYRRFIPRYRQT